jgi:UrcA family protein
MTHVLSALSALALGAGLALPAVAEPRPDDQLRSQSVAFSDLDLHTGSGAVTAVGRISVAARAVCDEYADSTRDIRARLASKRCRHDAMESAVTRLDSPRVTAAYFGEKTYMSAAASPAPRLPSK